MHVICCVAYICRLIPNDHTTSAKKVEGGSKGGRGAVHAPVTCIRHMRLSHAPVTCTCCMHLHMHLSHAPVTCSRHMHLSYAAVTCGCHMHVTAALHLVSALNCCKRGTAAALTSPDLLLRVRGTFLVSPPGGPQLTVQKVVCSWSYDFARCQCNGFQASGSSMHGDALDPCM